MNDWSKLMVKVGIFLAIVGVLGLYIVEWYFRNH